MMIPRFLYFQEHVRKKVKMYLYKVCKSKLDIYQGYLISQTVLGQVSEQLSQ